MFAPTHPLYETTRHYRVFRGRDTRQLDGVRGRRAFRTLWYYEPLDYAGDTLWSGPSPTQHQALLAARKELEATQP